MYASSCKRSITYDNNYNSNNMQINVNIVTATKNGTRTSAPKRQRPNVTHVPNWPTVLNTVSQPYFYM